MFRKGYEFVKKHKKKAVLAGAVYGGVYAYHNCDIVRIVVDHSWRWTWNKLTDLVPALTTFDAENEEDFQRREGNYPSSFSSQKRWNEAKNGEIANDESVVAAMLQLLEEAFGLIEESLNTEVLRQKISQNPGNRMELWEEMKLLAWCRCIVSIYTVCHLVVYLKVQTGVGSRFMYSHSAESTEKLHWKLSLISRHMQCTEYPVREGLAHLIKIVKSVVQKPVAPRSLQDGLSLGDVKQIIYEVRKLMEAGTNLNGFVHPRNYHLEFLVPSSQLDRFVEREPMTQSSDDRLLLSLTEDANKALESVDCNLVLNCCLEKCFSRIFSEVDNLIKERQLTTGGATTVTTGGATTVTTGGANPVTIGGANPVTTGGATTVTTGGATTVVTGGATSGRSVMGSIPHAVLLPALDRMSRLFASPQDAEPLIKDLVGLNYFAPFVDRIVRQSLQRDSLAALEDT